MNDKTLTEGEDPASVLATLKSLIHDLQVIEKDRWVLEIAQEEAEEAANDPDLPLLDDENWDRLHREGTEVYFKLDDWVRERWEEADDEEKQLIKDELEASGLSAEEPGLGLNEVEVLVSDRWLLIGYTADQVKSLHTQRQRRAEKALHNLVEAWGKLKNNEISYEEYDSVAIHWRFADANYQETRRALIRD